MSLPGNHTRIQSACTTIGFKDEDDWFDYQLENDPKLLARVEQARASFRSGHGTSIEDLRR